MSYCLIRDEGTKQTSATALDATFAVRLMRRWAEAYPQHYLVLSDEQGRAVAFRSPELATGLLGRTSLQAFDSGPRLRA